MKTLKYISLRAFAIAALALVFAMPAKAQMTDNGYANIDWQFNFPLNNHFADKGSGWGMNFEGGYFLTSNFALGGFLAYHSNHEYFSRQTLPVGTSGSLNTDQQHTVFQLPFGLATPLCVEPWRCIPTVCGRKTRYTICTVEVHFQCI